MATTKSDAPKPANDDRLQVIAQAVRTAYGDDALRVARHQIDAADGESRADWTAIARLLQG